MLYIDDLKGAYKIKRAIMDTEREILLLSKEIEVTKNEEIVKCAEAQKDSLELAIALRYEKLSRIEEFIDSCDDPYLSQAMRHRFLNGEKWRRVATSLGGYSSAESIRKMVERYLKQKGISKRVGEA